MECEYCKLVLLKTSMPQDIYAIIVVAWTYNQVRW